MSSRHCYVRWLLADRRWTLPKVQAESKQAKAGRELAEQKLVGHDCLTSRRVIRDFGGIAPCSAPQGFLPPHKLIS